MKAINSILFWASGARTTLLDKITEFEKRKFQLIGISFLVSSILSTVSAFYAVQLVSQNIISSILIGIMWGIMITNLNRLFIASIIDNQKNKRKKLFWFLPSILLSVFIALTIAFPLQLKVFEQEINNNIIKKKVIDVELVEKAYQVKLDSEYVQLKKIETQLSIEIAGISGNNTTGQSGKGMFANELTRRIEEQKKLITELKIEKSKLRENLFATQSTFIEKAGSLNELLTKSATFRLIYILIFLVLLLVESMPFVVAFTSRTGLYEELVERIDSTHFAFDSDDKNKKQEQEPDSTSSSLFQKYCISSILDINHNIDGLKAKAQEQLRNGLLISLLGILAYLGYGTFLFILYFETHKFQNHHIFLFSSLSVIFFFMQFLGGWYLKQYRTTIDYSKILTNEKERYSKYILAKLATTELKDNDTNKLIETKLLIELIGEIKITDATLNSQTDNANFAKDVFDSINNLKDAINNLGSK